MTSRSAAISLAMLAGACVIDLDPIGDDDVGESSTTDSGADESTTSSDATSSDATSTDDDVGTDTTTTDTTDTTTTDTTDTTTTDTTDTTGDGDGDTTTGGSECGSPVFPEQVGVTINLDNEPIGANLDLDLACTVLNDNSPALLLDCPQFELTIVAQGELAAELPDPEGATVLVRLITKDGFFLFVDKWLRLDFVGSSKSVFVIDALELAPPAPSDWISPWGLAVVDECASFDDGCGEWVGQTLGVAWENQTLELSQGGSASIGNGSLKMWVDRAWRYETIGPACDSASSWHEVAIVSSNLVESEVCIPGETDPCGTGLECCYPCGIPDCDFVCTPEDPDTMSCPPPPP
ncbi:hypothetical protein ACNOYE_32080 [Nannocystaceae bacterium ST9]